MERKQEWLDEPDKALFVASGLPCRIERYMGHLNGYVGVPKNHSLYKIEYNKPTTIPGHDKEVCPEEILEVHGGITFSNFFEVVLTGWGWLKWLNKLHIAFVSEEFWWFGFDTAHCNDWNPQTAAVMDRTFSKYPSVSRSYNNGVYRNFGYVKAETIKLV